MSEAAPNRSTSRETRLLLLTLAVAIVVLVVLARFRFPERPLTEAVSPPLARLSGSDGFEDLSVAVQEVLTRTGASIVTLRTRGSDVPTTFPGLRVRDDLAVAAWPRSGGLPSPADFEVRDGESWFAVAVVARDTLREVVLVRVPAKPAPVLTLAVAPGSPGFLVGIHTGLVGPVAFPTYVGRADVVESGPWGTRVFGLPRTDASPDGALLFSTSARLVGILKDSPGGRKLVPAQALIDHATELSMGRSITGADAGFHAQALSPAMTAATGAAAGAVIGWVDPNSPAAGELQSGDVVTAVDDRPVRTTMDLERTLAGRKPGDTVKLTMSRQGQSRNVALRLRERSEAGGTDRATPTSKPPVRVGLGLTMMQRRGGVEVLNVAEGSAAEQAQVEVGDLVTWLSTAERPTPAAIQAAYQRLPRGGAFLMRVARASPDGSTAPPELLIAIQKP